MLSTLKPATAAVQKAQKEHQEAVEHMLQQITIASKSSEFRLMDMKTSEEEAKRRKISTDLNQKSLQKKNGYDQFMKKQSATFVHQAEKFVNSEHKLSDEEFDKWVELLNIRDKAWNDKGDQIGKRNAKKNAHSRATTAHQNGEKESGELFEKFYELKASESKALEEVTNYRKKLPEEWDKLSEQTKKKFQNFTKTVKQFNKKAKEMYVYEEAEESEEEADKKFNQAYYEFEAMDGMD